MSKTRINFIIDAVMFLGMMALTGTGYVRKYVLLSGSAARAEYGRKIEMTLLGITRDDWAQIHLYLGYFLLAMLLLHIVWHWKQILTIYYKWVPDSNKRLLITALFLAVSFFLLLFPFILKPVILS